MLEQITKDDKSNPFWSDEFGQALKDLGGDKCQVFNDVLLLQDALACPGHEDWNYLGDGYAVIYDEEILKEDFLEKHFNEMTFTKELIILVTGEGRVYHLNYDAEFLLEAKLPDEALVKIKSFLKVA